MFSGSASDPTDLLVCMKITLIVILVIALLLLVFLFVRLFKEGKE